MWRSWHVCGNENNNESDDVETGEVLMRFSRDCVFFKMKNGRLVLYEYETWYVVFK
jgi:hypothetical protein